MRLFEYEFPKNNEPVDDTEITNALLYFTHANRREFKRLCKKGMEVEYSKDELKTANISDFILYILKKNYGETKI
jgi:hypothetical protein|tara:strand:- start:1019 stop:1243 length:225 start_codon:yes stop_codon:yes gene_type:complete